MTPGVARVLSAPLSPDRDEAREWAERELADPAYAAAEPTLIDRIAQAVRDFFTGLFDSDLPFGWGPGLAIVAAIVVVVLLVAALLVWGRPGARARVRRSPDELFGDADARSAAQLRKEAAAAAGRGDWDDAIVLRFRALARGLSERTLVEVAAGTTVQGFAREVARAFPHLEARTTTAAVSFDDVRYLRRPGTESAYRELSALDDDLTAARPAWAEVR